MAAKTERDNVQIFDVWESLEGAEGLGGRTDMAGGALSYIAIFETAPKRGELSVHQHPDSDQILFVLRGECTTRGLAGTGDVLTPQEGVLIPGGSYYGFANTGEGALNFLSMRTESTGGRHIRHVPDRPSGVHIKIPQALLGVDAEKDSAEVYVMDHRTIAVSPALVSEWNRACLLRSSCTYRRVGDDVVIDLPQRITNWYELTDLQARQYRVVRTSDMRGVRIELPSPRGPSNDSSEGGLVANLATAGAVDQADDEVQVFRIGSLLRTSDAVSDERIVANSSNSKVGLFRLASGQSSAKLGVQPDCEQILFVVDGACALTCDAGEFRLKKDQGFLVAAGASYAVSNPGAEGLALLWMRTEAAPEEHTEKFPSDLRIRMPREELAGQGVGRNMFLYTLTRRTIGVSFARLLDWDYECLVRMHAPTEGQGDDVWITLPERVARWYGLRELEDADYRFLPDGREKTRGRIELLK